MTSDASFKKIITYITNLATQHVDIKDAYRFNRIELAGALKKGVQKSLMLIDSVEVKPSKTSVTTTHNNNCAFTILGKEGVSTAKIDAYDAQNEVIDWCQAIAFEVAARIIEDASDSANKWLYGAIDINSFHYYKAGPLFTENLYGYRVEFTINSKEKYKIDPAKWADKTE